MSENKLKLNPDKSELIVFGTKDRYKWLSDSFPVNILGNCLSPTDVVRNLGVLFDAKFCLTNHINSVIKSCFISLRDLHRIRRFLSSVQPEDTSLATHQTTNYLQNLVLVYKYLTTGQPKYFAPYFSLYKSAMNTRCCNP